MTEDHNDELITNAINAVTEKLSNTLLEQFLKLPEELRISLLLVKSSQLLLANVLCHVASNNEELEKIVALQDAEIKELTFNCAYSGFADKFSIDKH
jgi:hypothetical protein